jgi:hypothetical protein
MDITDSTAGVPLPRSRPTGAPRTMAHRLMVQRWRAGRAETVSPEIISYALYDGCWWRRIGGRWESIPDGPLIAALAAGHARLVRACGEDRPFEPRRGRDPWAVVRNRNRMGIICDRPRALVPMSASDLRPFPPARCDRV